MKAPTRAAWVKALKSYEAVMNMLLREDLTPAESEPIFRVHDLLRTRASGGER